jgi:outer membrane autotransporter protein
MPDRAVIGIAASHGRPDATSKTTNTTDAGVDSYQATLYGNYQIDRDAYIDATAAYGWNIVNPDATLKYPRRPVGPHRQLRL